MLTAADIIEFGLMTGPSNETASEGAARIVEALDRAGLLAPTPQIIRTVKGLKALDEDSVVLSPHRDDPTVVLHFIEEIDYDPGYADDLPAVEVATGSHYRACREALEGASDG